ncbi:NTP transferase domain-containing protein [Lysobacter korlensis]|uniref:NTP transferase domain-containing protein n=1 Tax=Lysobacter korlensis TaxID=553636 RepID=A0ABV6RPA1_9GAMM
MTQGGVAPGSPAFDAVLLAGGRASRLGGLDKPALRFGGRSLLAAAVHAVRDAESIVVVGPERDLHEVGESTRSRLTFTREDPPFGGPAAALGAGLDALGADAAPSVVVLAADQPNAPAAVERLLAARDGGDGVLAVDSSGRRQYLLARYRSEALRDRLMRHRRGGSLTGSSLRNLIDGLDLAEVVLTDDLCSDVDTEEDARRFGIRLPSSRPEGHGSSMTTRHPAELDDWARRLIEALGIELDSVDIDLILDVARDSAHAVMRPAAPVTTFLVGYAAAAAGGGAEQIERASRIAQQLSGTGDHLP